MTRKTPLLLPLALLLALSACKPAQEPTPASSQPPAQAPTPTAPAPVEETPAERTTAEFPTLKMKAVDGSDYDLAAHRGKWVVVNFWATWCAPCRKEMPELSALHAMRSNIEVVGLAYEDIEVPEMQSFLTKHPVTYPIVIAGRWPATPATAKATATATAGYPWDGGAVSECGDAASTSL